MEQLHEEFIRTSFQLAEQAVAKGNHPFGALLVYNGEILLTAENTVETDHDITAHAEINLVRRASQTLDAELLRQCTLYTSTEPCAMCSGAIYWQGLAYVVFGCSSARLLQLVGGGLDLSCREVFLRGSEMIEVIGPVLEDEGMMIHERYWKSSQR
jgi:tRNA(Arg) A34 adenosine deaminase TadA